MRAMPCNSVLLGFGLRRSRCIYGRDSGQPMLYKLFLTLQGMQEEEEEAAAVVEQKRSALDPTSARFRLL